MPPLWTGLGDWSFHVQGQYLLQLESQAAPTTAYVPLANTVFNPPRVRVRAGTGWSYQGFTVTLTGDYTSSTQDTLVVSAPRVASWLIWDSQVSYNTGAALRVNSLQGHHRDVEPQQSHQPGAPRSSQASPDRVSTSMPRTPPHWGRGHRSAREQALVAL